MKKVKVLDCTLRDGGYVNNWHFGNNNIKVIIDKLNQSKIDIIECGFLRDDVAETGGDYSIFRTFQEGIKLYSNFFLSDRQYALMMLAEKYDISHLCDKNQSSINTIRLSFHKRDISKAIEMSKIIIEKGYKLFLQPTATMRYSDDEIKELIRLCNDEIQPDSLAIVDTFGEMNAKDIVHYTKLFDESLNKNITLSFHSHNNLQTAFSNAILFIDHVETDREIVVDSSVYGMGRGAGNLCTELILNYLNKNFKKNYDLFPILEIVDNILNDIKKNNYWGYSLEYYLSAINHCHPNYCIYFSNLKTLTTYDLQNILSLISEEKRMDFDKEYAVGLYQGYNSKKYLDKKYYTNLKKQIENKSVILIGPGKSILDESLKIKNYINNKEKYYSISINANSIFDVDAVFISNRRRYEEFKYNSDTRCLVTSNINTKIKNAMIFDYYDNLAREFSVSDNALLMILNILKKSGVSEILLAGFDGFSIERDNNYYTDELTYIIDKNRIKELNNVLKKYIKKYKEELNIKFLTSSKYEEN